MKVSRRFAETYRLYLQVRRVSQARNQHKAGRKQLATFFMLVKHGDIFPLPF
jgi:hypothetical protein